MPELQNVLFVASRGTFGGPNQSLLSLLAALDGKVHRVLAAPATLVSAAVSRNVTEEVYAFDVKPILSRLARIKASWRLALWLKRRVTPFDVIHANNLSGFNIAALGAYLSRTPVVVWSHASQLSPVSVGMSRFWANRLPSITWVAVSSAAAELLKENNLATSDAVGVIPNPIDRSSQERRPSRGITIAYLGGPAPFKGYQLVADVVRLLQEEKMSWLVVAGELAHVAEPTDPATVLLKSLEGPKVEISGWILDVERVYASSTIVFCPSSRESFGRVAAEAMVNGVPVVASDIPAFRELLGPGEAGVLFPPGDAMAAAHAVLQLANDSELRARLSAAGKQRARLFAPDAVGAAMLDIYNSNR